ncbi:MULTISPECIES: DUF6538 domain-containing protein [Pseudomonas syringae group]|uniref:DUF6538 domain-containing protein n=1 Tax=Pseudomonas syringae pv. tagetis TaxID=129140 RepID=A0A0Q0HFV6_9PSED|nr:DUF6538 domain-containing protein [Pseudomonas syringae group genomosp. 7]KPY87837.1 Uncharacterized protein ALO44_03373 [Pseudomonas syringae pv. tagetis]RMW15895.1 hypothetical protein ALO98_03848 [Pseudomonas syringae pv. tagetis]RMW18565.1 hypothetical protein ALO97_02914 [Pseudomonas syringae pv. tagetis]
MSYLSRRDGRYHYRRRFPADVALIVGRAEFRKALGTADRAEALRLARQVSVEFDKICAQAVQGHCGDVRPIGDELPGVDANAVLSGLQAVVERVTLAAVQAMHPRGQRLAKSWQAELEWQERAWQAVADGTHIDAAKYHPLEAMAALKAIRAVRDGSPMPLAAPPVAGEVRAPQQQRAVDDDHRTGGEFAEALDGYCQRVSSGRASIMRKLCSDVLSWPSTQAEQVQRIMQYAEGKLASGGKASSVHTQAAGLITILRELPGWSGISLPRTGAVARAVRAGAGLSKDARDSMPLAVLDNVHKSLAARGDEVDATAARLLVRYGLRPIELLQEGLDALSERVDILGTRELVFRAGLSGAKNSASRRDLPVHDDDITAFKLVLAAVNLPENATKHQRERRGRQRVTRLSAAVRIGLRGQPDGLSLYSLRHTCADLLRAVGASGEEVGAVLGHTSKGSRATSIYGGSAPLDRPRALLAAVRNLLD